jgi:hypothetical protein
MIYSVKVEKKRRRAATRRRQFSRSPCLLGWWAQRTSLGPRRELISCVFHPYPTREGERADNDRW